MILAGTTHCDSGQYGMTRYDTVRCGMARGILRYGTARTLQHERYGMRHFALFPNLQKNGFCVFNLAATLFCPLLSAFGVLCFLLFSSLFSVFYLAFLVFCFAFLFLRYGLYVLGGWSLLRTLIGDGWIDCLID